VDFFQELFGDVVGEDDLALRRRVIGCHVGEEDRLSGSMIGEIGYQGSTGSVEALPASLRWSHGESQKCRRPGLIKNLINSAPPNVFWRGIPA